MGQLLKERICSYRGKPFSLRVDPMSNSGRAASFSEANKNSCKLTLFSEKGNRGRGVIIQRRAIIRIDINTCSGSQYRNFVKLAIVDCGVCEGLSLMAKLQIRVGIKDHFHYFGDKFSYFSSKTCCHSSLELSL